MSFFADPDAYLEHNFQDHQVIKHKILMLTTCMYTIPACVSSLLQAYDNNILCTIISVVEVHVLQNSNVTVPVKKAEQPLFNLLDSNQGKEMRYWSFLFTCNRVTHTLICDDI